MRTKNSILGYAAAFVAAALALAGCQRDLPAAETATPDYDNLKFVVTVSEKSGNAAYTRALKEGWANGDRIVAFFNNDKTKYVVLTYDKSTVKWTGERSSVAGIAVNGTLQALHAGSAAFDFDGTDITGISGDLLYAGAAGDTYSIDAGTSTAYLTLAMTRGLTSAIKMEGGPEKTANEKWRVAGDGMWVSNGTTTLAASTLGATIDFGGALQELFVASDAETQKAAVPDPAFTDNDMAVFHIWNKGEGTNTVFYIYNTDDPSTVYTRTYDATLVAGETVLLAGPGSSDENESWKRYITPSALSVAVPLVGSAKPTTLTGTNTGYSVSLTWSNGNPANFAYDVDYTVTATLTADEGYIFNPATVSGFTLNGQTLSPVLSNANSTLEFTSAPFISGDIARADWTVTTQTTTNYGYLVDGTTGKPEDMFDGKTNTYISLSKQGQGAQAAGDTPGFTVDMKTPQEFDYIVWAHRTGNNYNRLRVFAVELEGSDDDVTYTPIAPVNPVEAYPMLVWIPIKKGYVGDVNDPEPLPYVIPVAKSTYRYIRVHFTVDRTNYDVNKYQHPDWPGKATTSGGSDQVSEFGMGLKAE